MKLMCFTGELKRCHNDAACQPRLKTEIKRRYPVLLLTSLFAGVSMLMLAVPLSAQESAISKLTEGLTERVSFTITGFSIQGDNPLSVSETNLILDKYIGSDRGIDDIESAADDVEQAINAKGLSFYRVSFPPQELTDGIVDLLIKRYTIGRVDVRGNKHYSDDNVRASLPLLTQGESPSATDIAQSLRLANENAGKRVRVTLAPGAQANEIDAKLTVADQKPTTFSTWLNNTGTEVSGDYRVGVSAAHSNLFDRDHSLSLSYITSPEGIDDVQQLAASYRVPLYRLGGTLSAIAVQSDIDSGTIGGVFDVAGSGEVYGLGYKQALKSIGRYHHSLSAQLSDKLFDNDIRFLGNQLLSDVRSRPLTLAYQSGWTSEKGMNVRGSIGISDNLGGGSFNDAIAYELSRSGAVDDWQKLELGLSVQLNKAKWLYSATGKLSVSDDRLITGEQFAVGGNNSVRGMEERELRGDEGYQLNLQAWAPEVAKGLRPVVFMDFGHVENNRPIDGELSSESVVSAGVLLNWNPTAKISASASYGYLLDGVDTDDEASAVSRDGDSKVHFNIAYRF